LLDSAIHCILQTNVIYCKNYNFTGLLLRNPRTTKKIAIKGFHANAICTFVAKIKVEH